MNILVLIKQVPDLESRFQVEGNQIRETDLAFRINEYDEFAVEQAVQVKEANPEASLTVLCIGPERAGEAIKKALAMGCDQGLHIVASGQPSPLQKAQWVQAATQGKTFDLIFAGQQSQDLGSGQTGVLVGELLNMEVVTTVVAMQVQGNQLTLQRELEGGQRAKVKVQTPALVTCQLGLNSPRYPTLPNIMKAKKKEILKLDSASLGGAAGPSTKALYPPDKKGQALVLEGDLSQMADQLIATLKAKAAVL